MKQIVVLSGKGGTGKTSLVAALAHLAASDSHIKSIVLADVDVDAANLELVIASRKLASEDFWGGQIAIIDQAACTGCGDCFAACRFDAIHEDDGLYHLDPIACDGCAACLYQCPTGAISMKMQVVGQWYRSASRLGPLLHAELRPAQENSGKLVTLVKQHARLLAMDGGYELMLIDGPPGIGCPVISAVSGADLALIVAEPGVAGTHDMRRALETVQHFGIQAMVCINKADLYPEGSAEIAAYCQEHDVEVLGKIPFDETTTAAMIQGQPVTQYQPEAPASQAFRKIWERVVARLDKVAT
jgi:MinD superfamily P-loop ATPase